MYNSLNIMCIDILTFSILFEMDLHGEWNKLFDKLGQGI